MADIALDNVGKTYPGGVVAVADTTLAFRDGEFIVMVGPSGCGKSTLLRMIAGLEPITRGTISIGGRVVNDVAARDRDVAMVFQNYALYPHMTVRQNMAFALVRRMRHGGIGGLLLRRARRRAEMAEIARMVEETARSLDIADLLDRRPAALSGGQRQRVALGRALVRKPRVFLLDEPLSNLDARLRIGMRAELRALHRRTGITMVHVTHDQEEAMTLADRMVVLRGGVVQQFATPAECHAAPANRFVAGFVGVPTMNFLEGRIEDGVFSAGALRVALPAGRWTRHPSGPCVLGIRPDQARVVLDPREPGALPARLEAIEHLGDRTDFVLRVAGHTFVARTAPVEGAREEAEVGLHLDLRAAHLFEPGETGARIPFV
jgi:multiple sugar transport system ATP-binding protein